MLTLDFDMKLDGALREHEINVRAFVERDGYAEIGRVLMYHEGKGGLRKRALSVPATSRLSWLIHDEIPAQIEALRENAMLDKAEAEREERRLGLD